MPNRDHIYVLQTLDIPDASRIKELGTLTEGNLIVYYFKQIALIRSCLDISQVKNAYGSTDKLFHISDLFWVCSDLKSR
jgi:hypothetical protein